MKKYILVALVFFIAACSQNKNHTDEVVPDTANFTPPVIVKNDTAMLMPVLEPSEMRDDSVFTDGTVPASWANAGFTDVNGFKLFLKQVQLWVMDNDKEKLASILRYPLKNIKTPAELLENYDAVFTKEVKLSFATIHFNQIFRNQQGAMTDGGKVWFAQQGKAFKIIAIN